MKTPETEYDSVERNLLDGNARYEKLLFNGVRNGGAGVSETKPLWWAPVVSLQVAVAVPWKVGLLFREMVRL